MLRRFRGLIHRAVIYRRRYGWGHFVSRLLRFWVWLPRLLPSSHTAPRAGQPVPPGLPFGVNVIGYLSGLGSFGEVARLTASSLQAAGVPVALIDQTLPDVPDRQEMDLPFQDTNPYCFNLLVDPPALSPDEVVRSVRPGLLAERYNIALWAWEFDEVPDHWQQLFPLYSEVWAPSSFVQAAVSKLATVPVTYIPHPMRPRDANLTRSQLPEMKQIPPGATVFLYVFNYSRTSYGRKYPEGAIEAFRRAFSPADNAWLVIKSAFRANGRQLDALRAQAAGLNVIFISAWLDRGEVDSLMASCDCYVSLHRAEGFGLTMAEAMSLAKPVIATAYSGNMDFTSKDNCYLVEYELVQTGGEEGSYQKHWLWAEPDLDQAAAHMRRVFESPEVARIMGEKGRADVERLLSLRTVGECMKQRLTDIISGSAPDAWPDAP